MFEIASSLGRRILSINNTPAPTCDLPDPSMLCKLMTNHYTTTTEAHVKCKLTECCWFKSCEPRVILKLISRIGKNGNAMNSPMNMNKMNTMRSICSFLCFQQLTMLCLLIQLVTKALFVCQTWRERESQSLS